MNSVSASAAVAKPEFPQCPICLEDIYPPEHPRFRGKRVAIAEPCRHKFHRNCIIPWVEDHLTCPVGRRVIENLIDKEAVVEIRTLPPNWQQQMVHAAIQGDIKTIRILLNRGADANAGQSEGDTPLAWATSKYHFDVAFLLLSKGASDPIGMVNLGGQFMLGVNGLPPDLHQAERWLLEAARHGSASAMYYLGCLYHSGGKDFPANPPRSHSCWHKSARLGDDRAMNALGYQYMMQDVEGYPRHQRLLLARYWLLKAVELGNPAAQKNLDLLQQQAMQTAEHG